MTESRPSDPMMIYYMYERKVLNPLGRCSMRGIWVIRVTRLDGQYLISLTTRRAGILGQLAETTQRRIMKRNRKNPFEILYLDNNKK